jgi:hypothetical protein
VLPEGADGLQVLGFQFGEGREIPQLHEAVLGDCDCEGVDFVDVHFPDTVEVGVEGAGFIDVEFVLFVCGSYRIVLPIVGCCVVIGLIHDFLVPDTDLIKDPEYL